MPLVSVHAAPGTITDSAVIVRVRARATSTFTKFFSAMRAGLDDSALQDCYIVMASEHIIYTESQPDAGQYTRKQLFTWGTMSWITFLTAIL